MKTTRNLALLLGILFISHLFNACSNEDDTQYIVDRETSIIGEWKQVKSYYQEYTSNGAVVHEEYSTTPDEEWVDLTFNDNGTYLAHFKGEDTEKGHFQVNNNHLIWDLGDQFEILELTKKDLVIEFRDNQAIEEDTYYLQRYFYERIKK